MNDPTTACHTRARPHEPTHHRTMSKSNPNTDPDPNSIENTHPDPAHIPETISADVVGEDEPLGIELTLESSPPGSSHPAESCSIILTPVQVQALAARLEAAADHVGVNPILSVIDDATQEQYLDGEIPAESFVPYLQAEVRAEIDRQRHENASGGSDDD